MQKAIVEIFLATALTIGLLFIVAGSNFFSQYPAYQQSIALVIWIYVPTMLILLHGKKFQEYGITLKNWSKSLRSAMVASLIVFPPYIMSFYLFEVYGKLKPIHFHFSDDLLLKVVSLTLFVSLPEEYFFRGYLQSELNGLFGKEFCFLGVNYGWGLILAALLFGLVHTLFGAGWTALLTIFPGLLFGWLREYSGGILAPTLFHGFGNVVYVILYQSVQGY